MVFGRALTCLFALLGLYLTALVLAAPAQAQNWEDGAAFCPVMPPEISDNFNGGLRVCPELFDLPVAVQEAVLRRPRLWFQTDNGPGQIEVLITAQAGQLISWREDTRFGSNGSGGRNRNLSGGLYDLDRGETLTAEDLFENPQTARTVLSIAMNAITDSILADPSAFPWLTIEPDRARSRGSNLANSNRITFVEAWLVEGTVPDTFGGITLNARHYAFDPWQIQVTVPQNAFSRYVSAEYQSLFRGAPVGRTVFHRFDPDA